MKLFARKRYDVTPSLIVRGLLAVVRSDEVRARAAIGAAWGGEAVVAFSVRSAFDALLAAVDWPPGSEVLMSAVTIPHMADLVRLHGFVPVPLDLDPASMMLEHHAVDRAVGAQTRAVVFTQLFGASHDVTPLVQAARDRGLLFIEDRAQAYPGLPGRSGIADVELYSFGSIKTATCLGGGVALVADAGLRARIEEILGSHPRQSSAAYGAKLLKHTLFLFLTLPRVFDAFCRLLDRIAGDYDAVIRRLSREFGTDDLLPRVRRRPAPALLHVMAARFASPDPARVHARRVAAERVARELSTSVDHLGARCPSHTHWLFPISSANPGRTVRNLRAAGFDATSGASTLVSLAEPCSRVGAAMASVVYVPVYPEIGEDALDRLIACLRDCGEGAPVESRPAELAAQAV